MEYANCADAVKSMVDDMDDIDCFVVCPKANQPMAFGIDVRATAYFDFRELEGMVDEEVEQFINRRVRAAIYPQPLEAVTTEG